MTYLGKGVGEKGRNSIWCWGRANEQMGCAWRRDVNGTREKG
jgi:hypothetical protein